MLSILDRLQATNQELTEALRIALRQLEKTPGINDQLFDYVAYKPVLPTIRAAVAKASTTP